MLVRLCESSNLAKASKKPPTTFCQLDDFIGGRDAPRRTTSGGGITAAPPLKTLDTSTLLNDQHWETKDHQS
jgi:hypothetical protein